MANNETREAGSGNMRGQSFDAAGTEELEKSWIDLGVGNEDASSARAGGDDVDEGGNGIEQALAEKTEDAPPNGGYGWVCVACVATINA